jgi:hypothetical protein
VRSISHVGKAIFLLTFAAVLAILTQPFDGAAGAIDSTLFQRLRGAARPSLAAPLDQSSLPGFGRPRADCSSNTSQSVAQGGS